MNYASRAVFSTVVQIVLAMLLTFVVFLVVFTNLSYAGTMPTQVLSPLPERTRIPEKPATWVFSANGGVLHFGSVTVEAPTGFTRQGGADIRANVLLQVDQLTLPLEVITGTVFAMGIWPPNDETQFEQPLELRILLDPATLSEEEMGRTQLVQYDPAQEKWLALESTFRVETYELVAHVKMFTPVAREFPTWGGRTFFAAIRSISSLSNISGFQATLLRNANLRSGPGTDYKIVRTAKSGETVVPDGRSTDGRWLRLTDGTWVAAFLVSAVPSQLPDVEAD